MLCAFLLLGLAAGVQLLRGLFQLCNGFFPRGTDIGVIGEDPLIALAFLTLENQFNTLMTPLTECGIQLF